MVLLLVGFFWKYLLQVKPNVTIAPSVAVTRNEQTGRAVYRFKIYNNSNRQVIGITLNAWICDLVDIPGGQISEGIHRFPIQNTATMTLNPEGKSKRPWDLTPEATFKSEPDFDVAKLLSQPNRRILITLRTTDALSQTTVVQQKTFGKEGIKQGSFKIGKSMDIEAF